MESPEVEAESVGSIVERHGDATFVRALMAAAAKFNDPTFEPALSRFLRSRPDLIDRWSKYSADQRWTPATYVDRTETGWYDDARRDRVEHPDEAAAVADFIHRTARYLAADRAEVPWD